MISGTEDKILTVVFGTGFLSDAFMIISEIVIGSVIRFMAIFKETSDGFESETVTVYESDFVSTNPLALTLAKKVIF